MDLVDEFDGSNCGENEAKRTYASTKRATRADYPSSNHVSHDVSNFVNNSAKNVSNYLTSYTKKTFDQLRQAFTEAPIVQHIDLEQFIWVETDVSGHAIGRVLSQLTNNLGWWHLIVYFLLKIIPTETQYKTYNSELLAIVGVFKTWRHY